MSQFKDPVRSPFCWLYGNNLVLHKEVSDSDNPFNYRQPTELWEGSVFTGVCMLGGWGEHYP